MNREQRRNEVKKNKQLSIKLLKEVEQKTKDISIEHTTSAMMASILTVMHDKYGFGSKRCQDVLNAITSQFESITEGYVSIEDIKLQIQEELGIKLS